MAQAAPQCHQLVPESFGGVSEAWLESASKATVPLDDGSQDPQVCSDTLTQSSNSVDESTENSTASRKSSASATAGRREYRVRLVRAKIFIDRLKVSEWPADISALADIMTNNNFAQTLSRSDGLQLLGQEPDQQHLRGDDTPPPEGGDAALRISLDLVNKVHRLEGATEMQWEPLSTMMLSPFAKSGDLVKDTLWDESIPGLSVPKPDYTLGLVLWDDSDDGTDCWNQPARISEAFLEALHARTAVRAWPFEGVFKCAFPCLVYEAKSDSGPLYAAINQAAGGAATALKILRSLKTVYEAVSHRRDPPAPRLPVFAICSMGDQYHVFIAFDLHKDDIPDRTRPEDDSISRSPIKSGVHLIRLWEGHVGRELQMYEAQLIFQHITHWCKNTYRKKILEMLEVIRKRVRTAA